MSTSYQDPGTAGRASGRHPINVGHLVMGIAFLGLVGVWALIQGDVVGNGNVRWLLPVPWVLAGLAGLLAIGLSGSKRWSTRQTGWVDAGRTGDPGDAGWVGAGRADATATADRADLGTDAPSPTDTGGTAIGSTDPGEEQR